MPVESDADLAGMFDAADHAVAATWRAGGAGAGVEVSIILDAPADQAFSASGFGAITARLAAMMRVAEAPDLARGDTLEVSGLVFLVEAATQDIGGAVWTATLSEAT